MFYKTCALCGANLDRGERCDCERTQQPDLEDPCASHRPHAAPAVTDSDYYDRDMRRRYRAWLLR